MSDHDPILLRRLLALRRFPLLAGAELAELAMLAENVVELSYPSGAIIAAPGRASAVHLILSGQIDAGPERFGAHEVFGWLEVLARRPLGAAAVAVGETRTLCLTASDLSEILEDNFGLLAIALRELATRRHAAQPAGPPAHRAAEPLAGIPLGLVERMIVLRQRTPFSSARLEALAILAYESEETRWHAGQIVCHCGEPARAAYFVLGGELRAVSVDGEPARLGAGSALAVIESLGGLCHTQMVQAVTDVRALEVPSAAIFNVLEDHPELGLALLSTFAGELLDAAPPTAACA